MTFNYITKAKFITWLRGKFRDMRGMDVGKAANWLLLNATDNQLKEIFSVTTAQLPALKTRLTTKRDAWTAARDMVGE